MSDWHVLCGQKRRQTLTAAFRYTYICNIYRQTLTQKKSSKK